MLYERRIESSLNRAMKELKRFQTIRRIEWENVQKKKATSAQAIPKAFGFEAVSLKTMKNVNLKKQSQYGHSAFGVPRDDIADLKKQTQFAIDDIAESLYAEDGYVEEPTGNGEENKANPSGHSMLVRNCRTDRSQSPAVSREFEVPCSP